MRIAIVSMDTRGGVQPYVALGVGLQRVGHDVRLVAPSDCAAMIAEAGIAFAPLTGSVEAVVRGTAGATEGGAIASMRVAARELSRRMLTWTGEALAAAEGVDVVTGGIGGMGVAL